MKSHHDGHVERSDPDWKDLGVDQVRRTKPTNRPANRVEEDGYNSTSRCMFGRGVTLDVGSASTVCRSEIGSNVGKCDDLDTDSGNERSPTSDKIDNEQGEQYDSDEFDKTIDSGSQEGLFRASNTKL